MVKMYISASLAVSGVLLHRLKDIYFSDLLLLHLDFGRYCYIFGNMNSWTLFCFCVLYEVIITILEVRAISGLLR